MLLCFFRVLMGKKGWKDGQAVSSLDKHSLSISVCVLHVRVMESKDNHSLHLCSPHYLPDNMH